jgi:hypothetical protein
LLYFPQRATVEELVSAGLRPWPSAQDFRGLVAEPRGALLGTAIVFRGSAGHVGHRAFYAQALVPLGFRVILAEYPGYGPRAGKPGEATSSATPASSSRSPTVSRAGRCCWSANRSGPGRQSVPGHCSASVRWGWC